MKYVQLICHLKLTVCSTLMSFPNFFIGCSFSSSSTLLTQLREPSSTIKLNREEESWITSVSMLSCPIGLLVVGILLDKIGRRKALQFLYTPMIVSWLTLAFANSYKTILIGKILLGIVYGVGICIVLYIAEICPANLRPLYVSLNPMMTGLGMMFECILEIFFHWHTISTILFVISFINFLSLFFVPESPKWLRSKGRNTEADKVDKWFDVKHVDTTVINESSANVINATSDCKVDDPKSYWSLYLQPTVWKPMIITTLFFVVQQFSGLYVLIFYSRDVLQSFKLSGNVVMLLAAARLCGSLSYGLCHQVKRRTLMVISGGSMAISLISIVAYMKIFENVENPPYRIIPITLFFIYMSFALLGVLPIPWIVCSEVFPITVRGVASGIVQICGFLLWFYVCKIYPWLVSTLGIQMTWSIFSAFCIINALYAIFIMPETQGKTIEEILSSFESPKTIKKINPP